MKFKFDKMKQKIDPNQNVPENFTDPEKLPTSIVESLNWQESNKSFWEANPMRYDWNMGIEKQEGTSDFFEEIDKRFFSAIKDIMPWEKIPFDNIIPFDDLNNMNVLEIGVGNGSHAGLISKYAKNYTGIDLTDYAVKMTKRRLSLLNQTGNIIQMDAEKIDLPDSSIDFIWSWGVIHHTSNTLNVIKEIERILKPGGQAIIMVYHRSWWSYYFTGIFIRGILCGDFIKYKTLSRIVQASTDGALARYYTKRSWKKFISNHLKIVVTNFSGNKADLIPLPPSKYKNFLLNLLPTYLTMILLNKLRMGTFLISTLKKENN
jgi:ubiquinone/menaquinone biosynthesis C-methylase UbiE